MAENGPKRLLDDPRKLEAFLAALTLRRGCHSGLEQGASVMEAVSYVAGLEWTETPRCSSQVISTVASTLNQDWSDEERQKLKPLIPGIATSAASDEIEASRAWLCADWAIRQVTPVWLDAASLHGRAEGLREIPELNPDSYPSVKALIPWGWRAQVWGLMQGQEHWQSPQTKSKAYEEVAFAALHHTDHAKAVVYADPDAERSPTRRPVQSWSRICDAAKDAVGDKMAPTRAKCAEMSLKLLERLIAMTKGE